MIDALPPIINTYLELHKEREEIMLSVPGENRLALERAAQKLDEALPPQLKKQLQRDESLSYPSLSAEISANIDHLTLIWWPSPEYTIIFYVDPNPIREAFKYQIEATIETPGALDVEHLELTKSGQLVLPDYLKPHWEAALIELELLVPQVRAQNERERIYADLVRAELAEIETAKQDFLATAPDQIIAACTQAAPLASDEIEVQPLTKEQGKISSLLRGKELAPVQLLAAFRRRKESHQPVSGAVQDIDRKVICHLSRGGMQMNIDQLLADDVKLEMKLFATDALERKGRPYGLVMASVEGPETWSEMREIYAERYYFTFDESGRISLDEDSCSGPRPSDKPLKKAPKSVQTLVQDVETYLLQHAHEISLDYPRVSHKELGLGSMEGLLSDNAAQLAQEQDQAREHMRAQLSDIAQQLPQFSEETRLRLHDVRLAEQRSQMDLGG